MFASHGSANPDACDYEAWLWRQCIGAIGYVRDAAPCDDAVWTIDRWRQGLSDRIQSELGDCPAAALMRALAVGDRGGLDDD